MKLRSFRLRIALLFAMLAGGALAGFGTISWWLIYDAKVSRLNAKLESLLIRPRPLIKDIWQSYENSLLSELGIDAETPIALLIIGGDRKTIYQSDSWSADFNLKGVWPSPPQLLPLPFPPRDQRKPPSDSGTQQPPEKPQFRSDRMPNMQLARPRLFTQHTTTGTWRIGAMSLPQFQVAIAVSLQAIDREMNVIRDVFTISIPIVLLLITGGAWWLSGSALRPIRELIRPLAELFYGKVEGFDMNLLCQCNTNKQNDCPIENLNVWLGYKDTHLMR